MWRVAAHTRISDGYADICERWSLDDLVDAHQVLDLHEDLEHKAASKRR